MGSELTPADRSRLRELMSICAILAEGIRKVTIDRCHFATEDRICLLHNPDRACETHKPFVLICFPLVNGHP
jgi:hypothetical protein